MHLWTFQFQMIYRNTEIRKVPHDPPRELQQCTANIIRTNIRTQAVYGPAFVTRPAGNVHELCCKQSNSSRISSIKMLRAASFSWADRRTHLALVGVQFELAMAECREASQNSHCFSATNTSQTINISQSTLPQKPHFMLNKWRQSHSYWLSKSNIQIGN